MVLNPVASIL